MKKLSAVVALSASLLSGCGGPSIEFLGVQPRKEAPAAVSVPEDVASFLQALGQAYGSKEAAAVGDFLSRDFVYQGMDKSAFIQHLAANAAYLAAMEIRPVQATARGEALELVAYGVMPRGPLPPSLQLLPLNTGATLVKEEGRWKLRGNQQQEQGIYLSTTGISAVFPPADLAVYRSLLPEGWEMPREPLVQLNFIEYPAVQAPLIPFRLSSLNIRVFREGHEAWFHVSMPETDWLPVQAGRTIGYPKFVGDISLDAKDEGWSARVEDGGKLLVAAEYVPDSAALNQWREFAHEGVIVVPGGPAVVVQSRPVGTAVQPRFQSGWLVVHPGGSGHWQSLLPVGKRAPAMLFEYPRPTKLVIPALATLARLNP